MKKPSWGIILGIIAILVFALAWGTPSPAGGEEPHGWSFPTIGTFNGTWELSVGAHLWSDHLDFRNLQLRAGVDLGPGLRWHALVRSNRLRDGLEEWEPRFDEHFVEWYGFHNSPSGVFSFSVKAGRVRYLRFPYPDAISAFDQVPGVEDLGGGQDVTGYSGVIATVDYAHRSGFGLHGVWIDWGFGVDRPAEWAERYVFYRRTSHPWHFEARWGDLALRSLPMGKCGKGYSIFVGRDMGGWDAGFLYEDISGQETYTGIVITFKQNSATRWMGSVAFDYTRSPEGFALQVPLLSGTFGNLIRMDASREPAFTGILMAPGKKGFLEARGLVLVGEIVAERIRTYWQNGQVRNWYEHRLSSWGKTSGKDVVAVMVEDPWYLQLEALVSPHTDFWSWDDIQEWERDRMGPAQVSQRVVYRFYAPPE